MPVKQENSALVQKGSAIPRRLLITIDGPAGAGKTTVSRRLAACLGYRYIDTGALYRAVAHEALRAGISPDDDSKLGRLCAGLMFEVEHSDQGMRLLVNGKDITGALRTPEIAMAASKVSALPTVRAYLLTVQRRLGKDRKAVFEGRDMGTVVFPDADIKFFLDAEAHVRALRRFRERKHPPHMTLEDLEKEILQRDRADSTRALAPLMAAPDAIRIDSSLLSENEVVEWMLEQLLRKETEPGQVFPQDTGTEAPAQK